MRIIISPAKKMRVDTDSLAPQGLPQFLKDTETLKTALQTRSPQQLQALWKCNDAIAACNLERLSHMDLQGQLTPAILSYEGIQYQYMAPNVFETGQYDYIQQHLRILSGFYGLLRPFDGVTPYRLEMQAKLATAAGKDLYAFWGARLAQQLASETDFILDLASKEYSKAVLPYLPHLPKNVQAVTCVFAEQKGGKLIEKGTMCKMARGQMVRWLAEQQINTPADIRAFDQLGYAYSPGDSSETTMVFIKKGNMDVRN